MTTFNEVRAAALEKGVKTVAVAAAADAPVLEAIRDAVAGGYAKAILVGDGDAIADIAGKIGLTLDGKQVAVIHEPDVRESAALAAGLVHNGKADILMKGLLSSADFLRAVLDKEYGLRTDHGLTAVGIAEMPSLKRLLVMADGGLHTYPDLKGKIDIASGIGTVCTALGIEKPKVAAVCAVEVVNPKMQPTLDAAELQRMSRAGIFGSMVVEGPLSLDIALSPEAASHKGMIGSVVAGRADALLMPNIETGNVFWKTITHFSDAVGFAGVVAGAASPVIMTSRADSAQTKLNSIALSILMCGGTHHE